MPAIQSRLSHIFTNPNIYDSIISDLSPLWKYRLRSLSRMTQQAVDYFDHRAFNINKHLSSFFNDPIAFRNLQQSTGTVISGSNALQFFERTIFENTDLNLYVHPGHAKEVSSWLIATAGYQYSGETEALNEALMVDDKAIPKPDSTIENTYDGVSLNCVLQFRGKDMYEEKIVHLMITRHSPMHAILQFHSSE